MTAIIHLWLASYGRAALILGLGLLIGYPAGRRHLRGPAAPLLAILLGLALLSFIVCLLAWLRWFAGWSILVTAAGALAASVVSLRVDLPRWRGRLHRPRPRPAIVFAFAILAVILIGFSVLALYPVNGFDATSYHLPLARDLDRHHGLFYDPFVRYSFFPQAGESIFAVMGLMSANPVRFSALEFSVLAVAVLLVPCWLVGARRGIGAGFVAAIVVLASPVVIFTGTTGYVDTWTMGFILAALLIGLDAAAGRAAARPAFLLMGLFIGEAAAAKYTGLLFGALTAVSVLVAVARWPWAIWRDLAAAVAGFCVTALPWYLWTIHTAGDPFYPFAVGIFGNGHHLWTPAELAFQQADARASPQPGFVSILRQDLHFLAGDIPYDTGANRSPLSWLLGLGVFGLLIRSARRDRVYLGALLGGVLCVVASLQLSADPRYAVPTVGPLAVAAGMTAGHVGAALRRWSPILRSQAVLLPAAMLAVAVVGLWSAAGYARSVYAGGRPPVSGTQVDGYVAARVPCFAAVQWLNAHAGAGYRAWGYVCEEARYYASGVLISDTFSAGSRLRVFDNGGSTLPPSATLWRRLVPLRVGWAILPAGVPPNPKSLTQGRFFQLAATTGAEDVYRIAPNPAGH